MQGVHLRVDARESADGRVDLRDARHEDQHVTGMLGERPTDGRGDVIVEGRGDASVVGTARSCRQGAPHRSDRVQGAGDSDHRSVAGVVTQQGGGPFGLDRGRHRHEDQVLAQVGPDVDEQRQGQVGVEVTLVHLVEHDGADAGELGIVLDPPEQQAGRDDLDPGPATGAAVPAHRVPDGLAHGLAHQVGQPTGGSAGREATGLRDDDPPRDDPPRDDPPKIGDKGTFDIGPLWPGIREVRLRLPIFEPPRPPVKVALLLPVEPRAMQAISAGGRPPRAGENDRLHLVEHIYAPDTTGQTLHVRITMAGDGRGAIVDWGDGTPVTDVKRDGKPIAAASVDREAVGRILFLGSKKKQP